MKIALCLSGEGRFINNALESQLIALTNKLKSTDQLIIYSGLWCRENQECLDIENEIRKSITEARRFTRASVEIRRIKLVDDIQAVDDGLLADNAKFRHAYSMYYSLMISILRCKSDYHKMNEEYDIVIKSRTDLGFHRFVDLHKMKKAVQNKHAIISQLIPDKINQSQAFLVNDQFIVGEMKSMSIIACVYFHLLKGERLCRESASSEELLAKYCDQMNISVIGMEPITTIQRNGYGKDNPKGNHLFNRLRN